MSDEAYDASLDLLKRLDPKNVSRNLTNLCRLLPTELAEELLSAVDQPLKMSKCEKSGKLYLAADYNRDGDSYRSPWSNYYYPKLSADLEELAPKPPAELRDLEVFANKSFDIYRDLYYEGGISSVYLWYPDEGEEDAVSNGFAGAILLKNELNNATWDGVHIVNVVKVSSSLYDYELTSTVLLSLQDENSESETLRLSGSLTRETVKRQAAEDSFAHVANIGSMVEAMESKLRNQIQEVYFGKTKDVFLELRSNEKLSTLNKEAAAHSEIIKGINSL